MKRLVRNLALVLVLVLAISSLPTKQAQAAQPKLAKKSVTLFVKQDSTSKYAAQGYVGESYGSASKVSKYYKSYKLKIKNLPKKAKLSVTSSNKAVATYSKSSKRITAKKPGKANFTVKVNGKSIGKIAVTVKSNASKVEITNLPADKVVGMDGLNLTAVQKDSNGNKSTDSIGYKITSGTDVATVDNNGKLQIVKPGTFKVMVYTYQSSKFPGVIASSEYELTAATKLVSIKPVSDTVVNVLFDSDMKDTFKAADFSVYTLVGQARMTTQTKGIALDPKDGKKVVIEFWSKLEDDKNYYIDYNGKTYQIPGSSTNPQDVTSIVIETKEVTEGVLTDITYKLYNKDGVLIALDPKATLTFTSDDAANCSVNGNQIIVFEKGKSVVVNAQYSYYYTAANGEWTECKVTGSANIVSVPAAPTTIIKKDWTVNHGAPVDLSKSYTKVDFVAKNDNNYYLSYRLETSAKAPEKNVFTEAKADGLTFKTSDPAILMINTDASCNSILVPANEGTANIFVYMPGNETPVDTIPIKVSAERVATTLEVKPDKNNLNVAMGSSVNSLVDTIKLRVNVKDQYNQPIATTVSIKDVGGSLKDDSNVVGFITSIAVGADGTGIGEIYTSNFGTSYVSDGSAGNLVLQLQGGDSTTKTNAVNVTIVSAVKPLPADNKGVVYKLELSENAIDTTVAEGKGNRISDYKTEITYSKYVDGYKVDKSAAVILDTSNRKWATVGQYFEVLYNGTVISGPNVNNGEFVALTKGADGKEIVKAKAGTYTVNLYDVTSPIAGKYVGQLVDSATFTIKDAQPILTFTQMSNKFDGTWDSSEFEVKYNGVVVTNPGNLKFDDVTGGTNVYLKSISYKVATIDDDPSDNFFDGAYVPVSASVEKSLTK